METFTRAEEEIDTEYTSEMKQPCEGSDTDVEVDLEKNETLWESPNPELMVRAPKDRTRHPSLTQSSILLCWPHLTHLQYSPGYT